MGNVIKGYWFNTQGNSEATIAQNPVIVGYMPIYAAAAPSNGEVRTRTQTGMRKVGSPPSASDLAAVPEKVGAAR